jgi:hypothetical protein
LFEGRALGIIDTTLDVLPNLANNSKLKGVVIFKSSQFASLRESFHYDSLPKEGAVVVLGPSMKNFGHIETLCAERGLFLIFNNYYYTAEEGYVARCLENKEDNSFNSLLYTYKKLHFVSNGLEGRIYAP